MPANNVGTRRKLNPKLKKGYVAPPAEDHIIVDEDQKQKPTTTPQQQQPVKTKKQPVVNSTPNNTAVVSTTSNTTTTTPQQTKKNVKSSSESRFEKYEKQHEAFIKQMETFMKSFIDFEKERLAFMREQFGSKNVGTTTTTQTTTTPVPATNKKATTTPNNTTTTSVKTTATTPTNKTTTVTPQTKTTSVTSSPKSTKNEATKNKDPAVDASPTKQQTKKTATTTTTSPTNTTTTTVPPTNVRELTIHKDEVFTTELKVVYVSGENQKAIVEANKIFDNLAKKDAVYGIDVLWNAKEEKTITEESSETYTVVPIRHILLATHDTVFVYRPPTEAEMESEKITRPLPVALYKILTQNQCVKVSFMAIDKVNYLYHNLNKTYVSHVSDINTLFEKEYSSQLDMISKELDLPAELVSKELKLKSNINYTKLTTGQIVTVAKRCWLEYRVVEKLAEKQKTKTSVYDFAVNNMKIVD